MMLFTDVDEMMYVCEGLFSAYACVLVNALIWKAEIGVKFAWSTCLSAVEFSGLFCFLQLMG